MRRPSVYVVLVVAAWFVVFIARLAAPSDITTRDQERVAAYILDIVENDHWLAQEDTEGNFASKPPLFNWLGALGVLGHGAPDRIAMSLPSWLGTFGIALLILAVGARRFGPIAGLWAGILYFASMLGFRQVLLLRTDALFQAFVFLGLILGHEALERRRSFVWFWLAGAASTMTKGPLGILLALPIHPVLFPRDRTQLRYGPSSAHLLGAAIMLAIVGGWFLLANHATDGRAFAKLISDELVGHALGTKDDFGAPGARFTRPTAWFLTRMAPMSLFATVAIVRTIRHRRADRDSFARCLVGQIFLGILIFSIAAENRFEHLFPLIPAAALLAGREVAHLTQRWTERRSLTGATIAVAILGAAASLYLVRFDAATSALRYSAAIDELAARLSRVVPNGEIRNFDAPRGLFVQLGSFQRPMDIETIRRELADRDHPSWIATIDVESLRAKLPVGTELHVVLAQSLPDGSTLSIVADRTALPATPLAPRPAPKFRFAFWTAIAIMLGFAIAHTRRVVASASAVPR